MSRNRSLKLNYLVKLPSLNYSIQLSRKRLPGPGGGWGRENGEAYFSSAPYFDSAHTELCPFSHSPICSLVLSCEVGRGGTIVSVFKETLGDIAEHPQGGWKGSLCSLCSDMKTMDIKDAGRSEPLKSSLQVHMQPTATVFICPYWGINYSRQSSDSTVANGTPTAGPLVTSLPHFSQEHSSPSSHEATLKQKQVPWVSVWRRDFHHAYCLVPHPDHECE